MDFKSKLLNENIFINKYRSIETDSRRSFQRRLPNIYISSEDELKFTIEIHFEDGNYYEIEISAEDTREDITDNLLDYLVLERFRNLQSPHINWNNVRYCEKHKIPL